MSAAAPELQGSAAASVAAGVSPVRGGSDFAPLMKAARAFGLLRPRRLRYAVLISVDLALFVGIWACVYAFGHTWWALFLAMPMAVFTARLIFIGHDACHRQVARTARVNHVMALCIGDLITGFGSRWWTDKHSRHHANPNQVGRDPDIGRGALVWTPEQAAERRGRFGAWAARHQSQLFLPMLLLEALNLKVASLRAAQRPRDLLLLSTHVIVYLGGLVLLVGPLRAVVFVVVHQFLLGLHLGVAFAPNHKGMPMLAADARWDFLRKQVLTSRNVSGGRGVDWFLGGLNHQIEHHLFPGMARPTLRRARGLVQAHCAALGLPYASETFRGSMVLTLRHLRVAGASARASGAEGTAEAR